MNAGTHATSKVTEWFDHIVSICSNLEEDMKYLLLKYEINDFKAIFIKSMSIEIQIYNVYNYSSIAHVSSHF